MEIPTRKLGSKVIWIVTILFVLLPWGLAGQASAEGALDPAPEITPAVPNGKSVLFDNAHAQTAGAADWVIDGGFSDFAQAVAAKGYYVKELRKQTPVTYSDLSNYDVFVIPEANVPFKKSEQDAMLQYVQNGGSIFFISDHYNADRNKNRWDASEVFNGYRRGAWEDPAKGMNAGERASAAMQGVESSDWLADNFGLRFRYNALGDINANIVKPSADTFGITEGVQSVAVHAGSTLMITDPTKAKGLVYVPKNVPKWSYAVDEGVYFNGGEEEGPYAAIAKAGKGKAGFIGDSSPVEDSTPKYMREENGSAKKTYDGFKEVDDAKLLTNMIDWLAQKEDYTSFSGKNIPLDTVSPQLNSEIPANSTEPQPEPWAQPAAGYLWYDASTFAKGSYGSAVAPEQQPVYTFKHPDVLPNNQTFTIQVEASGLKPGQAVTDLNLGIYNPTGGAQLAKVQGPDGKWPASYGYSASFALLADADGKAVKELTVQLNPDYSGNANIRLRASKTNLVTKATTIDTVAVQPVASSITKAREAKLGTEVDVQGVISTKPGLFGSKGFYLQDEAAGIYVHQKAKGFQVGDSVTLKGHVGEHQGELELKQVKAIEKTGSGPRPEPVLVKTVDAANQGQLITIDQAVVDRSSKKGNAVQLQVTAKDAATNVVIDKKVKLHTKLQKGDVVQVTGVASVKKGNYLLKVTDKKDVQLLKKAPSKQHKHSYQYKQAS